MKRLFNILVMAGFTSVMLSSCLKDTPITDYSDKAIKPVVLVPNGNWPRTQSISPLGLDFSTTPYELRVYARVSWDKPLSKSIDVTFKEDDAAISAYNTAFGQNWVKLNSTAYAITSLKVTIPAGTSEAYIPVKVFPDKIDLSKFNMLAFTITDASGEVISSNYQTIITPILVKNIYDADYQATGYFFHPSAPRSFNFVKHLYTVNDKRCQSGKDSEAGLGDLGGWQYRFDVNGATVGGWEAVGAPPAAPASGFMVADNPGNITFPGPQFPGTAPWVQTTYNNTYDAATKTFWMHYGYAVGSTGPNGYTRNIYEKLVRK
jgi:hypothetical protein